LADELARKPDEAARRSAISRAYYYVYNIALRRAEQNGFVSIKGESTHTQLWRLYGTSPEPDCIFLAQVALRLKEKRERADYKSSYPRVGEDLPVILADATDFGSRLSRLAARLPNPGSARR
jgi:hypothetical protein